MSTGTARCIALRSNIYADAMHCTVIGRQYSTYNVGLVSFCWLDSRDPTKQESASSLILLLPSGLLVTRCPLEFFADNSATRSSLQSRILIAWGTSFPRSGKPLFIFVCSRRRLKKKVLRRRNSARPARNESTKYDAQIFFLRLSRDVPKQGILGNNLLIYT